MRRWSAAFPLVIQRPGKMAGTVEVQIEVGIPARIYVAAKLLPLLLQQEHEGDEQVCRRALALADTLLGCNMQDANLEARAEQAAQRLVKVT